MEDKERENLLNELNYQKAEIDRQYLEITRLEEERRKDKEVIYKLAIKLANI